MGKIVRRTLDGDETVAEWSSSDSDSVRAAADVLRREIDAGYMAVAGGEGNDPVDELPPDAEIVILTMPMGGG
jgi:hypothetical protein